MKDVSQSQQGVKRLLHPKMKMLHLTCMSFQLHKCYVRLRNTIKDILDKNWEARDCPIDCQVNNTVEVQNNMKNIAREVHVPTVVQSELYETTRILFVYKKKKKTKLFSKICLLYVSPCQQSSILDNTHQTQAAYALLHPPQCKNALFSF